MLHSRTVAVVVPAYNEEPQIGGVIQRMPDFVDRIVVVGSAIVNTIAGNGASPDLPQKVHDFVKPLVDAVKAV